MKNTHKNSQLLKKRINDMRVNNPDVERDLIDAVRIKFSTLQSILYRENYIPNAQIRLLLAQFTGLDENELFPVSKGNEEAA